MILLAIPHQQPGFYQAIVPALTVLFGVSWLLHMATRPDPEKVAEFWAEVAEEEAEIAEEELELDRRERGESTAERPREMRPGFTLEKRSDGSWGWIPTNGGESDE